MSSTMTFVLGSVAGIGALLTLLQSEGGRKIVNRMIGALGGEPLPTAGAPAAAVAATAPVAASPDAPAAAPTAGIPGSRGRRRLDAPIGNFELPADFGAVNSAVISADGLLVVTTAKGEVVVFDIGRLRAAGA